MNEPVAKTEKTRILIIDDSITNLKFLAAILSHHGYATAAAKEATEAIQYVEKHTVDLILLDINMPRINGYQLCTVLKSRIKTKQIPVIFLSGSTQSTAQLKAFSVGGADFITKPYRGVEVLARIEHQLHLAHQRKTLLQRNRSLEAELQQHRRMEHLLLEQRNKLRRAIQQQRDMSELLRLRNIRLQRQATIDTLTCLANRRYFDQHLAQEFRHCISEHHPLSLVLCDIDHFKGYNDHYGHPQGDKCLYEVAQILASVANLPNDLVARYGGEEFALILPDTDNEAAISVVECIQRMLTKQAIPHATSKVASYVTMSFGGVTLVPQLASTPKALVQQADEALYLAKHNGRSQYCWHDSLPSINGVNGSHPLPKRNSSKAKGKSNQTKTPRIPAQRPTKAQVPS